MADEARRAWCAHALRPALPALRRDALALLHSALATRSGSASDDVALERDDAALARDDEAALRAVSECALALGGGALLASALETPLVAAAAAHDAATGAAWLAALGGTRFVLRAARALGAEARWAARALPPRSASRLGVALDAALVAAQRDAIEEAGTRALLLDQPAPLACAVRLLARLERGVGELSHCLQRRARAEVGDALDGIEAAQRADPVIFSDTLLRVLRRLDGTLDAAQFSAREAAPLRAALDRAYRGAVNAYNVHDAVAKAHGASEPLPAAPELLAKYANQLLCKGGVSKTLEGAELERALRDVITVFELVHDKDIFQKFYARLLAKRLVHGASVSDDAEKLVLGELKRVCGFEVCHCLLCVCCVSQSARTGSIRSNCSACSSTWARARM